jgi:hypothetical protein
MKMDVRVPLSSKQVSAPPRILRLSNLQQRFSRITAHAFNSVIKKDHDRERVEKLSIK